MASNRFRISAGTAFYLMNASSSLFGALLIAMMVFLYTVVKLNPLQLVLVGTVLEASAFVFEVPTGVVADIYSRRLSIVIGTLIVGAGYGMMGLARSFPLVLFSQVLCGLGYTFQSGATDAWLADEVGETQVGAYYVRAGQISRVTGMIGLGLAAVFGSIYLALPILVSGGCTMMLGLALALVMPESGFERRPLEKGEFSNMVTHTRAMLSTAREGVQVIRGRPILMILVLTNFMIGTFSEGFDRLGDAHLVADFTFPSLGSLKPVVWFSILGLVGTLVGLATSFLTQKRVEQTSTDRAKTSGALVVLNLGTSLCVIGFGLAGSFALAAACLLLREALLTMLIPLAGAFQVQNTPKTVRATVISMSGQSNALGQVVGGPMVGWIGTAFSLRAALVVAGLLIAPVSALYARARRYTQMGE